MKRGSPVSPMNPFSPWPVEPVRLFTGKQTNLID